MPAASPANPLIEPAWSRPEGVRALVTTRLGGASEPPFDSFNLAYHVGDAPRRVRGNRQRLLGFAGIDKVQWLDQEHGRRVLRATPATAAAPNTADASWTTAHRLGLAVLVADCVPLLLAAPDASLVAAVHCGWRGTVAGVVEAILEAVPMESRRLLAWLGPGVCTSCYQVGEDVRDALDPAERKAVLSAEPRRDRSASRWRMDLPGLVAHRLRRAGVQRMVSSGLCTMCDARFYSYRRDGETGRFAAMIWLGG